MSNVLDIAQQWVDEKVPYVWGGVTKLGADCSGFVQNVFSQVGISLPRTSQQQAQVGTAVGSLSQAQPGDLLFFNNNSHVAIYAGNGMMYDEPHTGSTARLEPVWTSSLDAIRNVGGNAVTSVASAHSSLLDTLKQDFSMVTNPQQYAGAIIIGVVLLVFLMIGVGLVIAEAFK